MSEFACSFIYMFILIESFTKCKYFYIQSGLFGREKVSCDFSFKVVRGEMSNV